MEHRNLMVDNTGKEGAELGDKSKDVNKNGSGPGPKEDQYLPVYNEALRKAIELRVKAELEAVRLYRGGSLGEMPAEESSLRDHMRILFRNKGILISTFIAVMASVLIGLELRTPMYEAKVKMLITGQKQVEAPYYGEMDRRSEAPAMTQSEIVKSNPVIQTVVDALELDKRPLDYEKKFSSPLKKIFIDLKSSSLGRKIEKLPPEHRRAFMKRIAEDKLRANIKVTPIRDTNLFTIFVRDYSPAEAAAGANMTSRSYIMFDIEQQLAELRLKYGDKHQSIIELKDTLTKMSEYLRAGILPNIDAIGPASVKVIEQAGMPLQPVGLPNSLILLAGLLAAIFLSFILAYLIDFADQSLKSPREAENLLQIPLLGAIHKKGFWEKPFLLEARRPTLFTRSYQSLSDHLYMTMRNKNKKSLLISDTSNREQAATIISNVGIYLARHAERNVLLIDANLRTPALYKDFNITDELGLVDVLKENATFESAVKHMGPNLSVLAAGRSMTHPLVILGSPEMAAFIKSVEQMYDLVLINCSNFKDFQDAFALAGAVEAVAVVVDESQTRKHVVKNAVAALGQAKAEILGLILNNRTYPIPGFIYNMT